MEKSQEQLGSFIQEKSANLVFGIAGRIGSGASFVTKALMEELKVFGYKPVEIKITKWLEQDYYNNSPQPQT